jgi:hypothetical protein
LIPFHFHSIPSRFYSIPERNHSILGQNYSILTRFSLLPRRNNLVPGRGEGIQFPRRGFIFQVPRHGWISWVESFQLRCHDRRHFIAVKSFTGHERRFPHPLLPVALAAILILKT